MDKDIYIYDVNFGYSLINTFISISIGRLNSSSMINNSDDNFDDIDLDEIFNDFNDNPPPVLTKSDLK
jgi:hypothetical protein